MVNLKNIFCTNKQTNRNEITIKHSIVSPVGLKSLGYNLSVASYQAINQPNRLTSVHCYQLTIRVQPQTISLSVSLTTA